MRAALRSDSAGRQAQRLARLAAAVLVAAATASLGGCGSISDKVSQAVASMPVVGLPANAPERPAETLAFPAVHDMPPPRTTAVLTADEQRSMERELVSAREIQKTSAKPPAPAPEPEPAPAAKPAAAKPAAKPAVAARTRPAPPSEAASAATPAQPSSSRMIY